MLGTLEVLSPRFSVNRVEENEVSPSVLSVFLESSLELRLYLVPHASSDLEQGKCVEPFRQGGCILCPLTSHVVQVRYLTSSGT